MITLRNEHLTVEIAPRGAELMRVCDSQGIERLWHGDPAFWSGRAPILFPVCGGFKEDAYKLDGNTYEMPKHGFAKNSIFEVEESTESAATFLLRGKPGDHAGFPFDFALRIRYALEGNALITDYITENEGNETFYFGVGAHEAYACPEGVSQYRLVFDEAEQFDDTLLDGNLLLRETRTVCEPGHTLPLDDSLFTNDALVFLSIKSRGVRLESALHDRTVTVSYPDFDTLLLWKKIDAPYICIEPWTNAPDFADTDQDITKKPGMIRLAAGGTDSRRHVVTFA